MDDANDVVTTIVEAIYDARNDSRTMEDAAADAAAQLSELIFSGVSQGERRITWKELYETLDARSRGILKFVDDLDRCQHGRHERDNCFGCNGPALGNTWIQELEQRDDWDPEVPTAVAIGHDLYRRTYFLRHRPPGGRLAVAIAEFTKQEDGSILQTVHELNGET